MSLKKGDILIIAAIAALSVAVFFALLLFYGPGRTGETVEARFENETIFTAPLGSSLRKSFHGKISIEIDNGRARVSAADCPDQFCVRSGWISSPGQSIVCLPNRLTVRVLGADSAVDLVT